MVSESFQVQQHHTDSLWSATQIVIGFGTVACLCFVLFIGLKWFRAQFKVQGTPKAKKSSDTVQGIGFKMKSDSENFQRYKSISEFDTPANNTNVPETTNQVKDRSSSRKEAMAILKKHETSNTFAKVQNKNKVTISKLESESELERTNVNTTTIESHSHSVVSSKHTEITKETTKTKEIQSQENKEFKKVSFAKNTTTVHENGETQIEIEENYGMQQKLKQNNPLSVSAQNTVMPQEDEDNWQIRIVSENSKKQIETNTSNDDIYYEEIQLASSNSKSNSMYSSQAASIFFGSYDEKQPPESPPPPVPRKFLEDDDAISMSSQTSA